MIIIATYLSPYLALIGAKLTACLGLGLPVLMAGDLNAKHVDWNSRLSTRGGRGILRDYADENSCLIFGQDSPTTNPHNPSVSPDVLDIVITKNLSFSVYLTSCSALTSDHLPFLIDTACRSSFHHPPDRPDVRRTYWVDFQCHLEDLIPFELELLNKIAFDTLVENFSGVVLEALAASTSKRRLRDDPRPLIPDGIQDEIRLSETVRRQWQIIRDLAPTVKVNRLQMSVTRRLNECRNEQWSATLESLYPEDQSLWRMTKLGMKILTPSPPWSPWGSLSQTLRKPKPLPTVRKLSFNL